MGKRLLGSVVATLSGWIAGWMGLILFSWYANDYFHHLSWYLVRDALGTLPLMGIFILPIWAVMVLPIYLQVPRSSFFWSPFVCVPFGAIVGFLTIQGFFAYDDYFLYHSGRHAFDIVWLLSLPGAVVGATTGLVATRTYHWFNAALRRD
jgi:hypothetical protein